MIGIPRITIKEHLVFDVIFVYIFSASSKLNIFLYA